MSGKKRKVLGRGLGALLKPADTPDKNASSEVTQLSVDSIDLNPRQPRQNIDEKKLDELARSIKAKGVIQPILVRPRDKGDKKYEVVAGERRLLATKLAGFHKIPALVKFVKDEELLEIALIENIQRDDLNPIEESRAYQKLLKEQGYTQDVLAGRLGKNRSTITNLIRLLQLPESIRNDVAAKVISTGHARALLALKTPKEQVKVRNSIVSENLSVRRTEEMVRALKEKKTAEYNLKDLRTPERAKSLKTDASGMKTEDSPLIGETSDGGFGLVDFSLNIPFCRENLSRRFAANVTIESKDGEKGKIEFEFDGAEDFQRLYSLLLEK